VETFYTYSIWFTRHGETRVKQFKATNPGSAFAKYFKKHPGAKLLGGKLESSRGATYGRITYESVSTANVEPLPAVKTEEITFPFFDGCLGKRPILTIEQLLADNGHAVNSPHIVAETAGEKAVLRKRARRVHEITGTLPAAVQLPH
jgi:hypothetical protein